VVRVFTGLVQSLGRVAAVEQSEAGAVVSVDTPLAGEVAPGDSVAVNGVCLTATEAGPQAFSAEVMNETLARTSLGTLGPGVEVNLELALRATDRLGGHVVQGHVDGLGTIVSTRDDGFARRVEIEPPPELLRYVVEKGSVAVDGVSLTVAGLGSESFVVSLIPETLERTNLGTAEPGKQVNLEVDVLAKYVERLIRSAA
jgi:riboflavin synthase